MREVDGELGRGGEACGHLLDALESGLHSRLQLEQRRLHFEVHVLRLSKLDLEHDSKDALQLVIELCNGMIDTVLDVD